MAKTKNDVQKMQISHLCWFRRKNIDLATGPQSCMGNPVSVTHIQISKADSKYQKLDSALHFLMIFTLQGVFVATAVLFWALWKIAYTFSIGHLRPQTNEHKNPRQKFKISPPYWTSLTVMKRVNIEFANCQLKQTLICKVDTKY